MIGDASGKEGQFSDSDKKTAENFGIVYMAYVGRSSCQLIQFIRHDNFQRPYFVGFGRQNSTTILHGILINAYICIHS